MNDSDKEKTPFRHNVHGIWFSEAFFRINFSEGNGMLMRNPNGKVDAKVILFRIIS
jgi:hypothetical protein